MISIKSVLSQLLVLLTIRMRSRFGIFQKIPVILLHWFAAQQQTSIGHFLLKFSAEFNELTPSS